MILLMKKNKITETNTYQLMSQTRRNYMWKILNRLKSILNENKTTITLKYMKRLH